MKKDLRIQKTQASLYRCMKELIENQNIEDITVSQICKKANINRSTFYDHYKDISELLEAYIKDILKELKEKITNNHPLETKKDYDKMIDYLLTHVEENEKDYKMIIKIKKQSILKELLIKMLIEKTSPTNNKYKNIFYISGMINILIEYIEDTKNFSKEEIHKILIKYIPNKAK